MEEAQSVFRSEVAAPGFQDEQPQIDNRVPSPPALVIGKSPNDDELQEQADEVPMCRECGRTFLKYKALYGHLRLHPDRGYKGANPPPSLEKNRRQRSNSSSSSSRRRSALPVMNWSVKAKRGRKVYAVERKDVVLVAAEILILMTEGKHSYDHEGSDSAAADDGEASDEDEEGTERKKKKKKIMSELIDQPVNGIAAVRGKYRCDQCNKTFSSHQALGGHRASHNKLKTKAEDSSVKIREESMNAGRPSMSIPYSAELPTFGDELRAGGAAGHQCQICGEMFPSGQALGGHKRRHYNAKTSADMSSPAVSPQSQ